MMFDGGRMPLVRISAAALLSSAAAIMSCRSPLVTTTLFSSRKRGFFRAAPTGHGTDEDVLGGAVEFLLAGDDLGEETVGQVTDGEIGQFLAIGNDAEHLDARAI